MIGKTVEVVLLKRMFNESDESVFDRWKENPYWQHFCGETNFQHHWPFDPTELIKFRLTLASAINFLDLLLSTRSCDQEIVKMQSNTRVDLQLN